MALVALSMLSATSLGKIPSTLPKSSRRTPALFSRSNTPFQDFSSFFASSKELTPYFAAYSKSLTLSIILSIEEVRFLVEPSGNLRVDKCSCNLSTYPSAPSIFAYTFASISIGTTFFFIFSPLNKKISIGPHLANTDLLTFQRLYRHLEKAVP
jgi:hypothetical protein